MSSKQLSVIVPAYNETDNIRPLCERLMKAAKAANLEVDLLVMDDESVGSEPTKTIVEELQKEGHSIRIHCRKRSEGRGLSSAVLLGFDMAKFDTILCMDADLQHEPEAVPSVAAPVLEKRAEFSVGSRNVGDGGLGFDWSLTRRLISQGATMLALPLTTCTDPMSGFFCTSKQVLARGRSKCNPIGFKIGLEIMSRCRCKTVEDVPITFRERVAGESKLTMKQNVQYIQQLLALYWDRYAAFIIILFVLFVVALFSLFNALF
eukprot:m.24609 g.24609  ORF g.24609 m.24609 type:complete len:263 (+) comp8622_c0_seq1:292-1080(+)